MALADEVSARGGLDTEAGLVNARRPRPMRWATLSMHLRYGITSTAMLEQAVAKVAARER